MKAGMRCPACDGTRVKQLASIGPVPVLCGSLWKSERDAVSTPTAKLHLANCADCAHIWNWQFNPALVEYDAKYDNALDFSSIFSGYAERLVKRLVDDYNLHGKRIIEIGSGKGEFLRALCTVGNNHGVGYDPTYEGPPTDGGMHFVREFFTPESAPADVDFICCRHVLEHLEDPYDFLLGVRTAVNDYPVPMYFEVPNASFNFDESGPWDLIYPHVAYFNETSLRALLTRAGFRVDLLEPTFSGQFLAAEVMPDCSSPTVAAGGRSNSVSDFESAVQRQIQATAAWRLRLDALLSTGQIAVWGAGSKGVTFLSLVDPDRKVGTVVDANPRKWGQFLPGSGHQIVSPAHLACRTVSAVLVMNPAYVAEITADIENMGVRAEVLLV